MPHDNIIQNVIPHLASLWIALRTGFVAQGLGLTVWTFSYLAFASRDLGLGGVWSVLAVGVLFLISPAFLEAISQTLHRG
jgi:hypothetical protein